MTSFPVAMPELNLVQDYLSGLTLPSLGKRIALSVKVDKDQSPIATRVGLSSVLNSGRGFTYSRKKGICTYSLLGLAFEKGKALQHKVLLIPGRKS
ncbi:hypothetical protein L6164_037845 [Bauhinia variegata]|uniref:Uncharacterized protein n=1 Tax=Bauhinia variegata TaxID=167791 RepID=A0ACB9KLD9_BAUVA|nr:hypothetical protein L6164_037845 [Bauhinia variegata]